MAGKTPLIPPPLGAGTCAAVFSPAGPVKKEDFERGLHELRFWELTYYLAPFALARCGHLAGRDEERAIDLVRLLGEGFPLLWASRGGYGCLRLLPWLDELLPAELESPFWLVGFSDVSILLNYFHQRFGLVTVHGPTVSSLPHTVPEARETLRRLLRGEQSSLLQQGIYWQDGEVSGPLLGGNLASLVSLLGTPWFPDLKGSLLFLEEVNESPYRVDRLLTQLALSGRLDGVKALVLGEFQGIKEDFLCEKVKEIFSGPVLACLPVGHGPLNFPLLIGAPSRIFSLNGKGFLEQRLS